MYYTIGVLGLWHLGCVISTSWSKLGNKVIGVDYDSSQVDRLNQGKPPIYEPFLSETIQEGLENHLLSFSSHVSALSGCDFVFLSYDTPVFEDDTVDTSILERSVSDLRSIMKDNSILIVSSQTPVGLSSLLRNRLKEGNATLELAYSPENLRLGEAIDCYLNPDRIILGAANKQTIKACMELFSQINAEIIDMNIESAELVKHGINSFLANSIVFINHLADICEEANGRIDDVVKGMKSDPRIGQGAYLSPGIGFSGGTLGRDLKVLSDLNKKNKGLSQIFETIYNYNSERKSVIVQKIGNLLGSLKDKTIGILGLTYKPGTSTLRRSLPLEIIKLLLREGSKVRVYDPKAEFSELPSKPEFLICKNIGEVFDEADILVLLTEWREFGEFDWSGVPSKMKRAIFLDAKNYFDEREMARIGFKYASIGRS